MVMFLRSPCTFVWWRLRRFPFWGSGGAGAGDLPGSATRCRYEKSSCSMPSSEVITVSPLRKEEIWAEARGLVTSAKNRLGFSVAILSVNTMSSRFMRASLRWKSRRRHQSSHSSFSVGMWMPFESRVARMPSILGPFSSSWRPMAWPMIVAPSASPTRATRSSHASSSGDTVSMSSWGGRDRATPKTDLATLRSTDLKSFTRVSRLVASDLSPFQHAWSCGHRWRSR